MARQQPSSSPLAARKQPPRSAHPLAFSPPHASPSASPLTGAGERHGPPWWVDAVGTTAGALLGTSTVTSYIESTAGVEVGARTGLASVVTSLLFLGALFLYPLAEMVGGAVPVQTTIMTASGPAAHTLYIHPITAPALILVGARAAWVTYPLVLIFCWVFLYYVKDGKVEFSKFRWHSYIKIIASVPLLV